MFPLPVLRSLSIMDLRGQRLAEHIYMFIIVLAALVAFPVGYAQQDFYLMITIFGGGTAIAAFLTIPDWPWFNKHPLQWLPAQPKAPEAASGPRKKKPEPSWRNFWQLF